jgi:hypothetical protein
MIRPVQTATAPDRPSGTAPRAPLSQESVGEQEEPPPIVSFSIAMGGDEPTVLHANVRFDRGVGRSTDVEAAAFTSG